MRAADVRAALRRLYAAPEYAIAFEVAQSTGHSANRHLDAVAMDLWPSRGLALHGIEIKVDIYDWRREKADPAKAEQIARFCDYFWIAAPAKLIPSAELPLAWGLVEVDDTGKAAEVVKAQRTEAQAVGRPFLAAMMRAAARPISQDEADSAVATRLKGLEDGFKERVKAEAERIAERASKGAKDWQALVMALGEEPDHFWESGEVIAAIKAVRAAGIAQTWAGLAGLHATLDEARRKVAEAIKDMALPEFKPAPKRKRA